MAMTSAKEIAGYCIFSGVRWLFAEQTTNINSPTDPTAQQQQLTRETNKDTARSNIEYVVKERTTNNEQCDKLESFVFPFPNIKI
jgi:hypothetical protein